MYVAGGLFLAIEYATVARGGRARGFGVFLNEAHNPCRSNGSIRGPCIRKSQNTTTPEGENIMSDTVNRQILLVEKPTGKLGPEHFKMVEGAVPEPKDGEVLVRTRYISLDAANRAWMHGATYRAAVEANTVMAGGGIAEVVSSKAPGFAPATSCSATPAGRITPRCPPGI